MPLEIGREKWAVVDCWTGTVIGIDGGGIILDEIFPSPVSLRLFMVSGIGSSVSSRFKLGDGVELFIFICCLRAISFENIDGSSA